MNELEIRNPDEISVEQEQKKELKYMGSTVVHPGHTLFEVNLQTSEIRPAEFDTVEFGTGRKVVKVKQDHYYISALNKKNVAKKLLKSIIS